MSRKGLKKDWKSGTAMIDLLVNPGQGWRDVHKEEYNNDIEMARGFKGTAERRKDRMVYANAARLLGLK
jgi:hypothetical protein